MVNLSWRPSEPFISYSISVTRSNHLSYTRKHRRLYQKIVRESNKKAGTDELEVHQCPLESLPMQVRLQCNPLPAHEHEGDEEHEERDLHPPRCLSPPSPKLEGKELSPTPRLGTVLSPAVGLFEVTHMAFL